MKIKEKLPEVSGFFSLLSFLGKPQDLVDDFDVGEKHTPTTVPLNAQAIQDVFSVLASSNPPSEFFPFVADEFAAGEASHGDNHSFFVLLFLSVALLLFSSCACATGFL